LSLAPGVVSVSSGETFRLPMTPPAAFILGSMEPRVATADDIEGIARVLTSAFREDPFWGWSFPGGRGVEDWWRFFARNSIRYPWTWIAGDFEAVAIWVPPGGVETTEEEEREVEPLLRRLVGDRAGDVMALSNSFGENHPAGPPHYYLSLLGVDEAHRGKGLGMKLLADNLRTIDETDPHPAYLESSNPANDARYARHGFRPIGAIERPDGGAKATMMWREAVSRP